ncbi:MAG: hypothetical protein ACYC96_04525 [Fimbriimonadaceae bacterium]
MCAINEAEEILLRIESKSRAYRVTFCFAVVGLATMVVAHAKWGPQALIRTKQMNVTADGKIVGTLAVLSNKIVLGTLKGSTMLSSIGEGANGGGVIALGGANQQDIVRLTAGANGGSISLKSQTGVEIANISPNVANAGSIYIDNAAGTLSGEINGDKSNGGAIILHNAQGAEIARVHQ